MWVRQWRTSFAPDGRLSTRRRHSSESADAFRAPAVLAARSVRRSSAAAVRQRFGRGKTKERWRRLRVVLARPGCVGACTKGLSVAAAALRRRIHRAVCSGEGGRRADGPVRRCSGRPRAMCACVCVLSPGIMCGGVLGSFSPHLVRVYARARHNTPSRGDCRASKCARLW